MVIKGCAVGETTGRNGSREDGVKKGEEKERERKSGTIRERPPRVVDAGEFRVEGGSTRELVSSLEKQLFLLPCDPSSV